LKDQNFEMGYNVIKDCAEALIPAGVMDAAKVIKNALIHANSSASIILLSEALIADAKEEN
jgi:chaperonin GroEL